jgi:hypothetical protein
MTTQRSVRRPRQRQDTSRMQKAYELGPDQEEDEDLGGD